MYLSVNNAFKWTAGLDYFDRIKYGKKSEITEVTRQVSLRFPLFTVIYNKNICCYRYSLYFPFCPAMAMC